jgi:cell fate regulator YaaT (PSP1 superfamily)
MNKIAGIRFYPWGQIYNFSAQGFDLKIGDQVVAETILGKEVGEVVELFSDTDKNPKEPDDLKLILRKATTEDLKIKEDQNQEKDHALKVCKDLIKKHELEMKLVDARFSFDGSRIIFAFTSEQRVDFRELVKDLSRSFQKSIRMHQIGSRDEARHLGLFGCCGKTLCCRSFKKGTIESITTEMARSQQLDHRGSARLSGACGRLLCCLSYEYSNYEYLGKNLPPLESKIRTKDGHTGKVIEHQILKQSVVMLDSEGNRTEVSVKEIK